jgi:protein-disulfide isomerase
MKRYFPFILILVVLAAAVGGGYALYNMQDTPAPKPGPIGGAKPTISPGALPAHVRGEANAPVVLEEFGDFQCPVCGIFYKTLKQVESEYGSRLAVIFREYPIQSLHPHGLEAARAAEAAGLQNRFWEMHDLLYENQDTWAKESDTRPIFVGYAKSLGLNVEQFTNDIDGNIASTRNLDDQKRAGDLGVRSTPTIFINGKPLTDRNIDGVRTAINNALKEKGL